MTGEMRRRSIPRWVPPTLVAILACGTLACAPQASNPVDLLSSATYVYAFEPEQVLAYGVEEDGSITALRGVRYRSVDGWSSVVGDAFGRFLVGVVSEKADAEVWMHSVDPASGALTLVPGTPQRPPQGYWFKTAVVAPSGRFLYVGAHPTDPWWARVYAYAIDPQTGVLTDVPGSPFGTRIGAHRLWPDPQGRFLYVSNSNKRPGASECISAYRIDAQTGALTEVESSPFKTIAFINQMEFHPSGDFVYATAGHYLLAYRVEPDGGLTPLPVPDEPVFQPSGTYVFSLVVSRDGQTLYAFQQSGWILIYRIDEVAGALTFIGELRGTAIYESWLLHPDGRLAFMLGRSPTALHVHRVDPQTGLLTLAGPPLALEGKATDAFGGSSLFLDATAQVLGVVVEGQGARGAEAVLHTFRIDAEAATLTPLASARLGETPAPRLAVVRRAPTWLAR